MRVLIEAQQLNLFIKQGKIDTPFTEAAFSFTDGRMEDVQKMAKWNASAAGRQGPLSASFLDSTQRHVIGLPDGVQLTDFFRAHESSHQWWGHKVGWKSYHDQWLSEGFAEFSGNLYVQYRENVKEYVNRWHKKKETLRIRDTKRALRSGRAPFLLRGS